MPLSPTSPPLTTTSTPHPKSESVPIVFICFSRTRLPLPESVSIYPLHLLQDLIAPPFFYYLPEPSVKMASEEIPSQTERPTLKEANRQKKSLATANIQKEKGINTAKQPVDEVEDVEASPDDEPLTLENMLHDYPACEAEIYLPLRLSTVRQVTVYVQPHIDCH